MTFVSKSKEIYQDQSLAKLKNGSDYILCLAIASVMEAKVLPSSNIG